MAKARDGKVLVMLSYVVDGMPPKYSVDYVMTKYTLLGLVKSLAVEYADKGITVNGISPAFTETRFVDGMLDYFKEENKKSSPIGRNLKVEDVIPTIEYMLSSGADCINGQNILITCGR
jgi:3-oxoacyl-[acyl-carrier protein] reductase